MQGFQDAEVRVVRVVFEADPWRNDLPAPTGPDDRRAGAAFEWVAVAAYPFLGLDFLGGAEGKLGLGGLLRLEVGRRVAGAACPGTGIRVTVGSALGVAAVNGERAAHAAWCDDCLPGERFLLSRTERQLAVGDARVAALRKRSWWHVEDEGERCVTVGGVHTEVE